MRTAYMKVLLLVCLAVLLAGCSSRPDAWRAEAVPVVLEQASGAEKRRAPSCPAMDLEIQAEAKRVASLESLRSGGSDALAAALIGSEANKNARLRQALTAYELCRTKMR
jgi:hypothetical protein